jgi:hypothetical protein
VTGELSPTLPAASNALHCNVCAPALSLLAFHLLVKGEVVEVDSNAPSTYSSTFLTATLSDELTGTETFPDTLAPLAGDVMLTVGGVTSEKLPTVTEIDALDVLPAASCAVAVKV